MPVYSVTTTENLTISHKDPDIWEEISTLRIRVPAAPPESAKQLQDVLVTLDLPRLVNHGSPAATIFFGIQIDGVRWAKAALSPVNYQDFSLKAHYRWTDSVDLDIRAVWCLAKGGTAAVTPVYRKFSVPSLTAVVMLADPRVALAVPERIEIPDLHPEPPIEYCGDRNHGKPGHMCP